MESNEKALNKMPLFDQTKMTPYSFLDELFEWYDDYSETIRQALQAQSERAVDIQSLYKKPDDPATEYKIIRAAGWNDCIDHLAENNHITCKQNAEKLTDTPEHVKENGNSLQVIEGLDDFLSDAFIDNFTCPDGKNWVCIANHINSKRKLEAGLKAAKAYKELCDKGGKS